MTADEVITKVTGAATDAEALAIIGRVPMTRLLEVADQLHVEATAGMRKSTLERAIVAEARA